jgi:DNA polymerase III subunit delta'
MGMHPLFGHRDLRRDLALALSSGRLPQVLLFVGEPGVGKQRLALWLAQLALCAGPADGEPCGACRPCRLVLELSHPDVHWFVPIKRPDAGEPDRQVEQAREALAEAVQARRADPVYRRPDGMSGHGMASARLLLRLGAYTTVEGGRRVIVVGEADRLVPQEANPEAANTLLKFLEEPPASTLVVLTATDLTQVLPTIRSRAVPVRVGRLSDGELAAALQALRPDDAAARQPERIRAAEGSLGRALLPEGGARPGDVEDLLSAARQSGGARFGRALRQGPWAARGEFSTLLDGLAEALGSAARAAATGQRAGGLPAPLAEVSDPARVVRALAHVDAAREAARGNVNPQLLLAVLTRDLAEALWA